MGRVGRCQKQVADVAIDRKVGARVFYLRQELGVTEMILAGRAGLHPNTIRRIENGLGCSVSTLVRIAAALQVDLNAIVTNTQFFVGCGP